MGAMYDLNVYGTPVSMLQIPGNVCQLITSKMRESSSESVRFTQDGMKLEDLAKILPNKRDISCAAEADLEVMF